MKHQLYIVPKPDPILEKPKHRDWLKFWSGVVLLFALCLGILMVGAAQWQ